MHENTNFDKVDYERTCIKALKLKNFVKVIMREDRNFDKVDHRKKYCQRFKLEKTLSKLLCVKIGTLTKLIAERNTVKDLKLRKKTLSKLLCVKIGTLTKMIAERNTVKNLKLRKKTLSKLLREDRNFDKVDRRKKHCQRLKT